MKIKNISHKVISIGTILLLPDKSAPVSAKMASLPSVKALVKAGSLAIEPDAEEAPEVPEKAEVPADEKKPEEVGNGDDANTDKAETAPENDAEKASAKASTKKATDKK